MPDVDFIVVGAGLAGACAARRLREHGSVLVVERQGLASGGSAAAAGLVNPILGVRARPVWRIEEAVRALDDTVALVAAESCYDRRPTLRPARDEEQIDRFRRTAAEYPQHCTWLDDPGLAWLHAPHGALRIETGGAIEIDALVRALLRGIEVREATLVGWEELNAGVTAHLVAAEQRHTTTARKLILALGRGYTAFPDLMRLRLHQVKGQTIRLTRPADLPEDAPHLAGTAYVAIEPPSEATTAGSRRATSAPKTASSTRPGPAAKSAAGHSTVVCGSTYEHAFAGLEASQRATKSILKKVARMLPSIRDAELIEARAGVRVTVPGIRLPMVGPIPDHQNVWIFTGLGAKGLLTGPLVAKELPDYLEDVERIPNEVRVRLAK